MLPQYEKSKRNSTWNMSLSAQVENVDHTPQPPPNPTNLDPQKGKKRRDQRGRGGRVRAIWVVLYMYDGREFSGGFLNNNFDFGFLLETCRIMGGTAAGNVQKTGKPVRFRFKKSHHCYHHHDSVRLSVRLSVCRLSHHDHHPGRFEMCAVKNPVCVGLRSDEKC